LLLKDAGYGLHGNFQEMPIGRTVDMIQLNTMTLTELTYLFGRDMPPGDLDTSFSSPASWPPGRSRLRGLCGDHGLMCSTK
jgi:hypothetical protein